VDPVGGWTTIAISLALVLVTAFVLRERMPRRVVDAVLFVGGAGVALGGLLLLEEVDVASWVVAPLVAAVAAVAQVRAMFAGGGPFRT
jgi:hypothetical protein